MLVTVCRRGGQKAQQRRPVDPARLAGFLQEAGVSYKPTARSYVFTCPRCHKPEKLWLYQDGSSFTCFSCTKFSGAVEYALAELAGRPVADVRHALYPGGYKATAGLFSFNLEAEDEEADLDDPLDLSEAPDLAWPLDYWPLDSRAGSPGRRYLQGRGIDLALALPYDIRYSVTEKSVVFPLYAGEQLTGWQHRYLEPRAYTNKAGRRVVVKTMSSEGIPRDRALLFQNQLVGSAVAVLGEGPVDALKAHFVGGNVAAMGKKVSDKQLLRLRRSGVKRVYMAVDPDGALEKAELLLKLSDLEVFEVVTAPYKDLGAMPIDLSTEAILNARKTTPGDFFFYFPGAAT